MRVVRLFILFLFFFSGCFLFTTKREGELLKQDLRNLQKEIRDLKGQLENDRKEYKKLIVKAQKNLSELERILNQATRMTANYGADIDQLKNKVAFLKGKIDELFYHLNKLKEEVEKRERALEGKLNYIALNVGIEVPLSPDQIPNDKTAHWKEIEESFLNKEYGKMRSLAKEFIKRYPKDERADDAQFKIGLSYLLEKRYRKALGQLQMVIDNYPKSDLIDDTLYYMGEGFLGIKDCVDAKVLWKKLLSDYPQSPYSKKARKNLLKIQRNKRRYCK